MGVSQSLLLEQRDWGLPFNPFQSSRPPGTHSTPSSVAGRREKAGLGGWEKLLGKGVGRSREETPSHVTITPPAEDQLSPTQVHHRQSWL